MKSRASPPDAAARRDDGTASPLSAARSVDQSLLDEVEFLVSRRVEGSHWDYKQEIDKTSKWKADFIHDILCLANVEHNGPRYLILGVSDDGDVVGLQDEEKKTQADITTFMRDNSHMFAESRPPQVRLLNHKLENKAIQIVIIENLPDKPYYLIKDYGERGSPLKAAHVYTRTFDRNTPRNQVAPPYEVDAMYRERFGLSLSPLDRLKTFLLSAREWTPSPDLFGADDGIAYYHTQNPEFTMRYIDAEDIVARNQEWTRGEIYRDSHASWVGFYYHQTRLAAVHLVTFDGAKKSMVAPKWEPIGKGRFYFHLKGSIQFATQLYMEDMAEGHFHTREIRVRKKGEHSKSAQDRFGITYQIPVINNYEMKSFLESQQKCSGSPASDGDEQYELFWKNQIAFDDWRRTHHK